MQKYESSKAKAFATSPGLSKAASGSRVVASAMADAAAAATARSVLKEVNRGALTPPLSSLSVPKLRTSQGGSNLVNERPLHVLESVRSRKTFDSDDEN